MITHAFPSVNIRIPYLQNERYWPLLKMMIAHYNYPATLTKLLFSQLRKFTLSTNKIEKVEERAQGKLHYTYKIELES
jgi:hypothetical protein